MNESIIISEKVVEQYTAQACLTALGVKIGREKMLEPIHRMVKIAQKTVKYHPSDKLVDGLIAILSGAHGLVEINKRVRSDRALQMGFGRIGCAEQSVVQDTLDACTTENVQQMRQAVTQIYRRFSQGYLHPYETEWQILDVDVTGRPCGPKAAFATSGYFAHQRNRRGRQEGYVIATRYEEIVSKQLFAGNVQLHGALRPMLEDAQQVLGLTPEQRQSTLIREDSGGGSVADVNWVLEHFGHFHGKDCSGQRSERLAESVQVWFDDPHPTGRQMGWVTEPTDVYVHPVRRIAVRCPRKNGLWAIGVLISTLSPAQALQRMGWPAEWESNPCAVLQAYVYFYDQRGGGVETEIKEDKQGLATSKRNKKRFPAQEMLSQLEVIAHNLLVWARRWLQPTCPRIARFGFLRLVRDALRINGLVVWDAGGAILQIALCPADPLAHELQFGLSALLADPPIAIILGET